jgi:hypothetical protein
VLRGAETPDYFSTRPTPELQAILRESPTLPLPTLLNRGGVRVDYEQQRIHRDSFWKGSFAGDTLLGWEERIRTGGLAATFQEIAGRYTGGSFWKRFDVIENGLAKGYVVNYEIDLLPGKPIVRATKYPDNNRKYFKAGDEVLLLTYTNAPYRVVYDVIKAIDENNCIGVMHLGEFPNGIEFATFVMARHNYPFDKMSAPDHEAIFNGDRARVPEPGEMTGHWNGSVIFLTRPDLSLLNQVNPIAFNVKFVPTSEGVECRFRLGWLQTPRAVGEDLLIARAANVGGSLEATRATNREAAVQFTREQSRHLEAAQLAAELRIVDGKSILGKWRIPQNTPFLKVSGLKESLNGYVHNQQNDVSFRFVLKRV